MRQALQGRANRQPARFIQRQAAVFQPVWRARLSNQKTMRCLYLLAICQRDAGAGNRLCRTVQIKLDPSLPQRLCDQAAGPFRQGGQQSLRAADQVNIRPRRRIPIAAGQSQSQLNPGRPASNDRHSPCQSVGFRQMLDKMGNGFHRDSMVSCSGQAVGCLGRPAIDR